MTRSFLGFSGTPRRSWFEDPSVHRVDLAAAGKATNQPELILVTGGCGLIGANLVRSLVELGYRVRVLDDLTAGRRSYVDGLPVEVQVGDVCDGAAVKAALEGCSAVVHLAARTSVQESIADPRRHVRVNIEGTLVLLEASVAQGIPRFVFASSNAALGEQTPPLHEAQLPRPISPYGASKLAGEALCSAYHGSFGLKTVALRFANAYGPFSRHKTSVVARFVEGVMRQSPLTIYGDGLQTRDFIYAADIAQAIVAALTTDRGGEVFQIATGRETSIIDLIRCVERVCGRKAEIQWAPARSGDVVRNVSSIEKARSVLKFAPRWSLQEGLAETWRWHRRVEEVSGEAVG